jgi:hypothetical protein
MEAELELEQAKLAEFKAQANLLEKPGRERRSS